MKASLLAVLIFICATSSAKEVVLDCKGTQTLQAFNATLNYQVVFDDETNLVTGMTNLLGLGCYPKDLIRSTGCECQVTKSSIGCDSSFVGGKNGENVTRNVFSIDRYTGRMTITDFVTRKDPKTNKATSYTAPGDLQCEVITKRKF